MRLLIARHGQAVSKAEHADRPLSEEGVAEVRLVASFLHGAGISVSRILHSGKIRASQTADIYAELIGGSIAVEEAVGLKPNDDPRQIAERLNASETDTLIAGHLPHLGRLTSLLLSGDDSGAMVSVPTGAVICLERGPFGDGWVLSWMIDPVLLG